MHTSDGYWPAEVTAVGGQGLVCMPLGPMHGLRSGAPVTTTGRPMRIAVGHQLRGRVLDGLGQPMDGGAPLDQLTQVEVEHRPFDQSGQFIRGNIET